MNNKPLSLILFDFDGVLSNGRFYSQLKESHPSVHQKIIELLFTKERYPMISEWMRGKLRYEDIHRSISPNIGKEVDWLNNALIKSVKNMPINKELVDFATRVRRLGVKTAVFTDNMDIFERTFVEHANLRHLFDDIFSSSTFGSLKMDDGADFFKHVLESSGCTGKKFLFLDDSKEIRKLTESLGGIFYHYNQYNSGHREFEDWFKQMYPHLQP